MSEKKNQKIPLKILKAVQIPRDRICCQLTLEMFDPQNKRPGSVEISDVMATQFKLKTILGQTECVIDDWWVKDLKTEIEWFVTQAEFTQFYTTQEIGNKSAPARPPAPPAAGYGHATNFHKRQRRDGLQ